MALNITLKPGDRIVVNGCVIRNGGNRTSLLIENQADVIREKDIIKEDQAVEPYSQVYFLLQSAIIFPKARENLIPEIQKRLGALAAHSAGSQCSDIFEAANHVSARELYPAMQKIRCHLSDKLK
jgi:flagellar biosynthesis repressor protein FlbT